VQLPAAPRTHTVSPDGYPQHGKSKPSPQFKMLKHFTEKTLRRPAVGQSNPPASQKSRRHRAIPDRLFALKFEIQVKNGCLFDNLGGRVGEHLTALCPGQSTLGWKPQKWLNFNVDYSTFAQRRQSMLFAWRLPNSGWFKPESSVADTAIRGWGEIKSGMGHRGRMGLRYRNALEGGVKQRLKAEG
jgi:hypothetical protein